MFRRQVKKTKRAGDAQAPATSYARTVALIHQQQVRVKGFRQSDGGDFSDIEAGHQWQAGRVMDLKSRGWSGDPALHR